MNKKTEILAERNGLTAIHKVPLVRRINIGGHMMDIHRDHLFSDTYVVSLHGCAVADGEKMSDAVREARYKVDRWPTETETMARKACDLMHRIRGGEKIEHGTIRIKP